MLSLELGEHRVQVKYFFQTIESRDLEKKNRLLVDLVVFEVYTYERCVTTMLCLEKRASAGIRYFKFNGFFFYKVDFLYNRHPET